MSNDGTSIGRVAGLHPAEEGQEGGGVLGNAVVGPRRELELANFPLFAGAVLKQRRRNERERLQRLSQLCSRAVRRRKGQF